MCIMNSNGNLLSSKPHSFSVLTPFMRSHSYIKLSIKLISLATNSLCLDSFPKCFQLSWLCN